MVRKTVSLCMIVKNEENVLDRCLKSVKNIVDEIIIVDTGSTDNTITIAKQYGAKIYNYEWNSNFAEARNYSIMKATSDYILVLDADEFVDGVTNLGKELSLNKDFYILKIKNYMSDGYVSYHQAIRLFKNNLGLNYYGKIHEHLNIESIKGLSNGIADILIHHDGYKKEVYKEKDKFTRNINILLQEVEEVPSGYNFFNLGVQYKVEGKYFDALKFFKQSYFLSKDKVYAPYLLYLMADCLLATQQYDDGIALMKDASELYPDYTGFYFLLGNLYFKKGFLLDAEFAYKKCLEIGEVIDYQTVEGVGSYLAAIKLSEVMFQQGNLVEALDRAHYALKIKTDFAPSLSQYIDVLIQANLSKDVILLNIKQQVPMNNNSSIVLLLGVLLAKRSNLLLDVIRECNVNVDEQLLMIAYLYSNQYEQAFDLWEKTRDIKQEYLIDILNLAIIRKDKRLIETTICKLKLDIEEKDILKDFCVKGDSLKINIEKGLSETIIKLLTNFLCMNEKFVFSKMIKKLENNTQLLFLIINQAYSHGFLELVIESKDYFINTPFEELFLEIAGDIYLRNGEITIAIEILNTLYNKTPNYQHLNKLYNFYKKINDKDGIQIVIERMSTFSLSNIDNYLK